jgi:hypothetical protein
MKVMKAYIPLFIGAIPLVIAQSTFAIHPLKSDDPEMAGIVTASSAASASIEIADTVQEDVSYSPDVPTHGYFITIR